MERKLQTGIYHITMAARNKFAELTGNGSARTVILQGGWVLQTGPYRFLPGRPLWWTRLTAFHECVQERRSSRAPAPQRAVPRPPPLLCLSCCAGCFLNTIGSFEWTVWREKKSAPKAFSAPVKDKKNEKKGERKNELSLVWSGRMLNAGQVWLLEESAIDGDVSVGEESVHVRHTHF